MALTFHWFLPTYGDSRDIVGGGHGLAAGTAGGARPATVAYLGQITRTAEQLGFEGALTPTGAWCEDAWLATAMLSEVTERLKFLVAFRPGMLSPTLAAQMASTFQRLSQGRLPLNVVTGGESHEQRAYGDFLDKDARYARTDDFLRVVRALWRGETVTHEGAHVRGRAGEARRLPDPVPPIYFGGSSKAAGPVAVAHSACTSPGVAVRAGGREVGLDPGAGRRGRAGTPLRCPAARNRPRHRRAGLSPFRAVPKRGPGKVRSAGTAVSAQPIGAATNELAS